MRVKHTVLPDGQPPTVAFTVLAQLCGTKANETEMDATLFPKNGEGKELYFLTFLNQQYLTPRIIVITNCDLHDSGKLVILFYAFFRTPE